MITFLSVFLKTELAVKSIGNRLIGDVLFQKPLQIRSIRFGRAYERSIDVFDRTTAGQQKRVLEFIVKNVEHAFHSFSTLNSVNKHSINYKSNLWVCVSVHVCTLTS